MSAGIFPGRYHWRSFVAKKTVRKSSPKARALKVPASASTMPAPASTDAPKSFGLVPKILVAAGLVFLAWEGWQLVNENIPPKSFPVHLVEKFSGADQPCGSFGASGAAWVGDEIAVTDQPHDRVLFFDASGKFLKAVGKHGKGPLAFQEPSAVASVGNDRCAVMDTWNTAIKIFDGKGTSKGDLELGSLSPFYGPRGLGYDGHNYVIADTGSHRIVSVSPEGAILKAQGTHGKEKDQWDSPTGVASDAKGDIYVADSGNHRIKILDPSWGLLKIIKLDYEPQVVAVDSQGRLYFTGNSQPFIPVYDSSWKLAGALTNADSGEKITGSKGIAVSAGGRLLLADGDTVQVYQIQK